ncbi:MAG TPA: Tat pathway signal sequence domain protein [Caulobacteraceae bacterium]|nr:Tat pathway signal sequence domain protein [Caulobacteraceae bacterium]
MRRLLLLLSAFAVASTVAVTDADAQQRRRPDDEQAQRKKQEDKEKKDKEWSLTPAPLRVRPNAGPCPYVKILYDAARYVEFDGREASSAVAYSGELDGIEASCEYREDDPINVDLNVLLSLGRGPQGESADKTYRYWVAVTARNQQVIAKQYFDVPVRFTQERMTVRDRVEGIVIPRASEAVNGSNFEILVGFDVTPEMAQFNREGKRFRVNAGQTTAAK